MWLSFCVSSMCSYSVSRSCSQPLIVKQYQSCGQDVRASYIIKCSHFAVDNAIANKTKLADNATAMCNTQAERYLTRRNGKITCFCGIYIVQVCKLAYAIVCHRVFLCVALLQYNSIGAGQCQWSISIFF